MNMAARNHMFNPAHPSFGTNLDPGLPRTEWDNIVPALQFELSGWFEAAHALYFGRLFDVQTPLTRESVAAERPTRSELVFKSRTISKNVPALSVSHRP